MPFFHGAQNATIYGGSFINSTRVLVVDPDLNEVQDEHRHYGKGELFGKSTRVLVKDGEFNDVQGEYHHNGCYNIISNGNNVSYIRPQTPAGDIRQMSGVQSELMKNRMAHMMQEMESEFEENNDDNDALHRSHSNPSHMKELANFDLPTSSNGPIFRTINGNLTKHLINNLHQANIMRGNDTIAFSFNNDFLVRLSGRHSSPASVAYQDEMHGTKEGPGSPIKTSADSPGHQILDNFSSNDGVDRNSGIDTTQILIAAEGALKYIRDPEKKAKIHATFLELRIDESQYTVLAGFNEGLIRSGFGYLEEIHVFCRVEILSSPHFLTKLGKVLAPYPGVVFTPSVVHETPVFKDDGTIWDYDDLRLNRAETFSAIRIEEILHSKLNIFASVTASRPSISVAAVDRPGVDGNDSFGSTLREKGRGYSDDYNHDCKRNSNFDDNDKSDDDAEDAGNPNSSTPGISFRVQTEIFKGTHLPSSSKPFQTFKINGIFVVKATPGHLAPRRLPSKSHVEFKKLKFQSTKSIDRAYEQVYAGVEIDAKDVYTEIEVLRPLNPSFNQATQEIPGSSSTESTKRHSRITEDYSDGVVSWGFCVDDMDERQTGIDFGAHCALPSVNFKFYGISDSNPPPPPPKRLDVLVKSCWSLIPRADCSIDSPWVSMPKGGLPSYEIPSYSNFCQVVILEVPSHTL